jgi:recombination protein RecT
MTSQEIALREAVEGTIAQLRDPSFEQQIEVLLPETISAKKFLRVAATAALEKPELAEADRSSLIRSLLRCAEVGLVPNGREAALVTFWDRDAKINKVTLMPMIGGLRVIAAEYGWTLRTNVVYEEDDFDYTEEPPTLQHRPVRPGGERGQLIAAWAVATHRDGRRLQRVLHPAEIAKRRASAKTDKVWKSWEPQMWEKTAGHDLFDEIPLDAKDRERIEKIAEATDDPATILYGSEDRQAGLGISSSRARPVEPARGDAPQESASPPPVTQPVYEPIPDEADDGGGTPVEPPFEGEEPVEGELVDEAAATFTAGKHKDRSLAEIHATGEEGIKYLAWAYKSWKQEPLRSALDAFAAQHPEIRREAS